MRPVYTHSLPTQRSLEIDRGGSKFAYCAVCPSPFSSNQSTVQCAQKTAAALILDSSSPNDDPCRTGTKTIVWTRGRVGCLDRYNAGLVYIGHGRRLKASSRDNLRNHLA